jgi:hypothetical protein
LANQLINFRPGNSVAHKRFIRAISHLPTCSRVAANNSSSDSKQNGLFAPHAAGATGAVAHSSEEDFSAIADPIEPYCPFAV